MVSRGWTYFLIGILLSSFLGGGIRVFFSPPRIRAWVEEVAARKQPKFTLEFEEARIAFANGWTPGLAVEFINLKIKARDLCITGSEILVDRMNLPVQASAVFSQKVKFGVIGVNDLRINVSPPQCVTKLEIPEAVEGMDQQPRLVRLEKFMKERWRREIQNTLKLLEGIEIEKLALHKKESDAAIFTLNQFVGQLAANDTAIVEFSLEPGVSLVSHQHVGKLRSRLELSRDSIILDGRGNLKEGQYQTELKWDVVSGFWTGQLKMQDMPASSLMPLMEGWGIIQWPEFSPRNQWFRCELKSEGSLVGWESTPVRFESCGFYGELGDIHIREGESKLFQAELFPITADFRNVDMGPLLMQFGQLRHWVSQEGRTSGELQLNEEGVIRYEGIWRNPQFQIPVTRFFKIGGIAFDQMHMTWDFDKELTQLKISKPTAYGQDFPLSIEVAENRKNKISKLKWQADWKSWPKAMERLMDSVHAGTLESTGEATLGQSEPQFQFGLLAKDLKLKGFKAENTKARFKFKEGKGEFSSQIQSIQLDSSAPLKLFAKLFELANLEKLNDALIKIDGEFDDQGRWVVNPLKFKDSEFVGRGYLMSVDQGVLKAKNKTFNVFGDLEEPRFEEAQ